jgi:hypothetical protein
MDAILKNFIWNWIFKHGDPELLWTSCLNHLQAFPISWDYPFKALHSANPDFD